MFDQSRQSFFAAKKANEYKQSLANSRHSKNMKKKKTDPEQLKNKRRIIAGCREAKRKFLFGTEMGEEESEMMVLVRMVSYLALGGAQI